MKKIFLLLLVLIHLTGCAQTIPAYKNVKLTQLPLGTNHDSIVMTNGSTKDLRFLPVSQLKSPTNLTYTASPTGGTVLSSTGTDASLPLATTTNSGLLSPIDKTTINGIPSLLSLKANDADVVHRTGTDVINGLKIFNEQVYTDALEVGNTIGIDFSTGTSFMNFKSAVTTAPRNVLLPDASGTIALTSDLSSFATVSQAQTIADLKVVNNLSTSSTSVAPSQNAVNTALDLKSNIASPTFTGTVTLPTTTSIGTVSNIEIGYVDGVTSSIQTQLNSKSNDSNVVHKTGAESITGAKIFTNNTAPAIQLNSTSSDALNITVSDSISTGVNINSNLGVAIKINASSDAPLIKGDNYAGGNFLDYTGHESYWDDGCGCIMNSENGHFTVGRWADVYTSASLTVGSGIYGYFANMQGAVTAGQIVKSGGTASQYLMANGTTTTKPYKVWTGLVSQTGANVPTAIVLENTLGGAITFGRAVTGVYTITSPGLYTLDKTAIFVTNRQAGDVIRAYRYDATTVYIETSNGDGNLSKNTIEIRVYN